MYGKVLNTLELINKNINEISVMKKYNLTLPAIGLFLFTFYILTQRWFELYLQSRSLQVTVVGFSLLLIFFGVIDKDFPKKKLTAIDYYWVPGIIMIIYYILIPGNPNYYLDIFIYLTGYALLLLAKVDIINYTISFSLLKYGAILFALVTIFQYLFTEQVNDIIFNFTVPSSQARIEQLVRTGYFPGLAFGQPAIAAGIMVVGLGLIYTFWASKNILAASLNSLFMIILFTGLIMTGKRSILLWFVLSLPITYIALGLKQEKIKRFFYATGIAIIVGAGLLTAVYIFDDVAFFSRLSRVVEDIILGEASGSIKVRLSIYHEAILVFLENPLFGVGWKQFEILTSGLHGRDYHVHNVYLQLLSEMGIIGFIAILLPVFYIYIKTYKILQTLLYASKTAMLWKNAIALSFYFQTFFLLYCLSENPFYVLIYALAYFFMISIVNSFLVCSTSDLTKAE